MKIFDRRYETLPPAETRANPARAAAGPPGAAKTQCPTLPRETGGSPGGNARRRGASATDDPGGPGGKLSLRPFCVPAARSDPAAYRRRAGRQTAGHWPHSQRPRPMGTIGGTPTGGQRGHGQRCHSNLPRQRRLSRRLGLCARGRAHRGVRHRRRSQPYRLPGWPCCRTTGRRF